MKTIFHPFILTRLFASGGGAIRPAPGGCILVVDTLRAFVVGLSTLAMTGYLALIVFSDGFQRSYESSETTAWKVTVSLVMRTSVLGSIVAPDQRLVMHGVAVAVIALVATALRVYRSSAFAGTTGLAYCGLWLGYYWQATWDRR